MAITEFEVGSYTVTAEYLGDDNDAATSSDAETGATLNALLLAYPVLAVSPVTYSYSPDSFATDTGVVTLTGTSGETGIPVDVAVENVQTRQIVQTFANVKETGTAFSAPLNLAEGDYDLEAYYNFENAYFYASSSIELIVDLTPPTSTVVNSLPTSETADSFPVSVSFKDPAGSGVCRHPASHRSRSTSPPTTGPSASTRRRTYPALRPAAR